MVSIKSVYGGVSFKEVDILHLARFPNACCLDLIRPTQRAEDVSFFPQGTIIFVLCGYAGRYFTGPVWDIACTVHSKFSGLLQCLWRHFWPTWVLLDFENSMADVQNGK